MPERKNPGLLLILLLLSTHLSLRAQEAEVKSVKSIYNRFDQSKIKLQVNDLKSNLLADLSGLGFDEKLNTGNFLELVAENKVPALQPDKFKRVETDDEIMLSSRSPLPDEFRIGDVTYYKVMVDLGMFESKKLLTEVYLAASENKEMDKSIRLNFNWSSLKINKDCNDPKCEEWVLEDGKAKCIRIRCD